MNYLSFNDVLIKPRYSNIKSRKDVSLYTRFCGLNLDVPIISANMDSVTGDSMVESLDVEGGVACLHRFQSIEQNVAQYKRVSTSNVIVSVGISDDELTRAVELHKAGARTFLVDVANGASSHVVVFVRKLREVFGGPLDYTSIIVGNFATAESVTDFLYHLGGTEVDALKVGIGGGSACLTQVVTGCGMPTLASIMEIRKVTDLPLIADGGIKNSGDIAKALAAGATCVMLGKMLAGTYESPGDLYDMETNEQLIGYSSDFMYRSVGKRYRGSASQSSYESQGKVAEHRSHEGDSFLIPHVGSLKGVIQQISGGLRSALSYTNSSTLDEFRENAEFITITHSGSIESSAHGRST